MLAEVARVLKPNGVVVLQVPNIESWQFKMFGAQWYGLDIPRHVIDYSKNSMETLLNDSGFVPSRIRHFKDPAVAQFADESRAVRGDDDAARAGSE